MSKIKNKIEQFFHDMEREILSIRQNIIKSDQSFIASGKTINMLSDVNLELDKNKLYRIDGKDIKEI